MAPFCSFNHVCSPSLTFLPFDLQHFFDHFAAEGVVFEKAFFLEGGDVFGYAGVDLGEVGAVEEFVEFGGEAVQFGHLFHQVGSLFFVEFGGQGVFQGSFNLWEVFGFQQQDSVVVPAVVENEEIESSLV